MLQLFISDNIMKPMEENLINCEVCGELITKEEAEINDGMCAECETEQCLLEDIGPDEI